MYRLAIPAGMAPGRHRLGGDPCLLAALERPPAEEKAGRSSVGNAVLLDSVRLEERLGGEDNEP
jgi:hypothetical protein